MKGILFKPDMHLAIREGKKTQTRRVIKNIPTDYIWWGTTFEEYTFGKVKESEACRETYVIAAKPLYQVGEVVYIKEAYSTHPLHYKLDGYELKDGEGQWHTPMFMPAWAARDFIKITDVRPERLQEITEESAIREGVTTKTGLDGMQTEWENCWTAYQYLWDSITPSMKWDTNPWVWAYEFKLEPKGELLR